MKYRFKFRWARGRRFPGRRVRQQVLYLSKYPGAGYIGGWTAYVAVNCQRIVHGGRFGQPIKLLQVGVTRNGNLTPYVNS